jgi:hypothetical protein
MFHCLVVLELIDLIACQEFFTYLGYHHTWLKIYYYKLSKNASWNIYIASYIFINSQKIAKIAKIAKLQKLQICYRDLSRKILFNDIYQLQ